MEAGDHWAYLLEPVRGDGDPGEGALNVREAAWIEPGHEA